MFGLDCQMVDWGKAQQSRQEVRQRKGSTDVRSQRAVAVEERLRSPQQVGANVVPLFSGGVFLRKPALVVLAQHPWTRRDVARELGVSVGHVTRLHRRGLPHVKPFGPRGIVRYCPLKVRLWATAVERS